MKPNSFQVFSTLHEMLLFNTEDVLKINGYEVTGATLQVEYESEESDSNTIDVSIKEFSNFLKNGMCSLNSVYRMGLTKLDIDIIASQKFLKSINIDVLQSYHKTIKTSTFTPNKTEYERILDVLSRFKYRSRIEKQCLLTNFHFLSHVDKLVSSIQKLEIKTSDQKKLFLQTNLINTLKNVDFENFITTVLYFYNFRLGILDCKKIETVFINIAKVWLSLNYELPKEVIVHLSEFIEDKGIIYSSDPGVSILKSETLKRTLLG